jgi:hypothetical protein
MKMFRILSTGLLAAGLVLTTAASAQMSTVPPPPASADADAAPAGNWTNEQLLTSSVHEAWELSGKNEKAFFQMVTQLATISAQKRGITLPESEEAGKRFGEMIKKLAKADTDQLLYVVVDKAVQKIGVAPAA